MSTRHNVGAALLISAALLCAAPAAYADDADVTAPVNEPVEGVCEGLDSGKIDAGGAGPELEISAPDGYLITGYCVKAGSIQQGDGPVYEPVDPPQQTIVISHPSGKDISHYSAEYELIAPPTTPPATTPPATTPPVTTPPAVVVPPGTPPAGDELAETGFDGTWALIAGLGAVALGSIVVGERVVVRRRSRVG